MPSPVIHALISTGVAAATYRATGDKKTAIASFLAGTAIDADHFVDFAVCKLTNSRNWLILPLHGWEYLAGLLAAGFLRPIFFFIAVGYGIHLTLDHIFNGLGPTLGYSLLWRIYHRFSVRRMRLAIVPHHWVQLPIWRWFH